MNALFQRGIEKIAIRMAYEYHWKLMASLRNLGQMVRRRMVDSIVVIIVESSSSQVRVYFFWKNFCFMV